MILAYTRDDVRDLNAMARARLREAGRLHGPDQMVATERGERGFAAGDRIMFGRNERGPGGDGRGGDGVAVKNGTLGTVLAIDAEGQRFTVRLDGQGGAGASGRGQEGRDGQEVTFLVRDYGHIDHGYAATVHKAQGVTVDRAHVLATPHMDRHAAYVGLTRHRVGVALHYGRDDIADPARLARTLSRERSKDTSLDYAREDALVRRYAERRGLAPASEIVVRREPVRTPESERAAAREAVSQQGIAKGRAGFRERFEAHPRDLVGRWDRLLEDYNAAVPRLEADPTLGGAKEQLAQFGCGLREQPRAVQVLRERGEVFGMAERPNLARVLADPQPERVVAGMMQAAETGMRAHLKEVAEQEAVRERELRARQRPSRGLGMGRG